MRNIILILLAIIYAASPYDILPDFVIGWGWIDDIIIFYLLWKYVIKPLRMHIRQEDIHPDRNESSEHSYNSQSENTRKASYFTSDKNPYDVLGLEHNATQAQIKNAYRQLVNKYHPDKVQHLGDEFKELAESRFKEIQRAFEQLIDKK